MSKMSDLAIENPCAEDPHNPGGPPKSKNEQSLDRIEAANDIAYALSLAGWEVEDWEFSKTPRVRKPGGVWHRLNLTTYKALPTPSE